MSRDDVFGNWSTRLTLAPTSVTKVPAVSGQIAISLKLVTGGTLEIGGATFLGGGQTFGSMYFISSNEVVSLNMSGDFYLWASSATCVVALLRGRSSGTQDVIP